MYFVYIDESGNKDINKQNKLYVLSAIIIHEQYWDWIHQETKNLKHKIWEIVKDKGMKYFGLNPDAFFNDYCDDLMSLIENKFYRHASYTLKGYGMMIFPRNIPLDEQFWKVFYGYD